MIDALRYDEGIRLKALESQYTIPTKLYPKLDAYEYIPWKKVIELYQLHVRRTCIRFNVELLLDTPFGKGFTYAYNAFLEDVAVVNEKYKKIIERDKNDKIRLFEG